MIQWSCFFGFCLCCRCRNHGGSLRQRWVRRPRGCRPTRKRWGKKWRNGSQMIRNHSVGMKWYKLGMGWMKGPCNMVDTGNQQNWQKVWIPSSLNFGPYVNDSNSLSHELNKWTSSLLPGLDHCRHPAQHSVARLMMKLIRTHTTEKHLGGEDWWGLRMYNGYRMLFFPEEHYQWRHRLW
jgi:hypothetical protein